MSISRSSSMLSRTPSLSKKMSFGSAIYKGLSELFSHEEVPPSVDVGKGLVEIIISAEKVPIAAKWLQQHHKGRFMVWSLLAGLDPEVFDNDYQDISVYVRESPVLEDLLKFCHSVRSWVDAEAQNIAVLLTSNDGKVAQWSSLLCCSHALYSAIEDSWLEALRHLIKQRTEVTHNALDYLLHPELTEGVPPDFLPPSHVTYLRYVEELVHHRAFGCEDALHVNRVVLHSIPVVPSQFPPGCFPVLTIVAANSGRLLFSSAWAPSGKTPSAHRRYFVEDCSALFSVETALLGDIIIKLHHSKDGEADDEGGEHLLDFHFHTCMTYLHIWGGKEKAKEELEQTSLLRLDRDALGIASNDQRFAADFSIDLLLSGHQVSNFKQYSFKLNLPLTDDNPDRRTSILQTNPSLEALWRLVQSIPQPDEPPVIPKVRPVLRVTPNPKDLLESDDALDTEVTDIHSVPILFSFPPVNDPFDKNTNRETLVINEADKTDEAVELVDGVWGQPVQGLCMVLPSLVVLEPVVGDQNARKIGKKYCQIRIPIEKLQRIELCELERHGEKGGKLRLLWDCGDAIGERIVVVWDSQFPGHVEGVTESIRTNKELIDHHHLEAATPDGHAAEAEDHELPELSRESMVFTDEMMIALRKAIPKRFRIHDKWELLYSTAVHGISLATFFRKTGWRAPTLILVMDDKYNVFGGFCPAPWETHFTYFGNGESFVFRWRGVDGLQIFRWSQMNDFFQLARNGEGIAMGGGTNNAIRLDPDFLHGSSGPCETFNSPALSSSQEFKCLFCEVWTFTD